MPHTYVSDLVHCVFSTKQRQPWLTKEIRPQVFAYLGGLIRDEDIKSMSKIPILGDLPIIGHLFRDHNNSHRRTEVMVALTIHVLK